MFIRMIEINNLKFVFSQGWVNEDKIKRHAFPPGDDTIITVCGLPGVYDKLCGPRRDAHLSEGSALHSLGYTESMVVKL
jgi:cytochrome-b5 reductase